MSSIILYLRHQSVTFTSLLLIILLAGISGYTTEKTLASARLIEAETQARQTFLIILLPKYENLLNQMEKYMDEGVDTTEVQTKRVEAREAILLHTYEKAEEIIAEALALLEAKRAEKAAADEAARLAAEKEKGTLSGKVTADNAALSGVAVKVTNGSATLAEATSDKDGKYSLTVKQGSYTVTAAKSGYNTFSKNKVEIKMQETTTLDITLTKRTATPAPTTTTSTNQSVDGASYEKKTVSTSRGSFTVDMITLDMTKVKMITDTANDNDCSDNCPTKALATYVSSNGGFAGINGTYFCPSDYADCAGKTNTFHWKVWNNRLSKFINEHNGLAENDPVIAWGNGSIRYYKEWNFFKTSGFSVSGEINSRPRLVEGGNNIVNVGDLDDKQKGVKSNRGGLGVNGNTLYAVVARSATVVDLAEIMKVIGSQNAMNIDGGGSSALYFSGSYRVGPGRSLPNAVIFAAR